MKFTPWILAASIVFFTFGCGEDKPAAPSADAGGQHTLNEPTNDGAPGIDSAPVPPAGAMFTICCKSFTGDSHITEANEAKTFLLHTSGMKDFYCYHTANDSTLYYGYYTSIDRSQTAEYNRAHEDQAKLSKLADQNGDQLFPNTAFVAVLSPDPPAPKEWDLASCKGFWTLQIAVYKDSPQRKQYAVDAVRDARARGIEAYFYHGEDSSEVCIGSWPREAVQEGDAAVAKNDDPHKPLLVLGAPIKGMENGTARDRQGNEMTVIQPKLVILDQTLKAAIAQYPYTLINGMPMGRPTADGKSVVPDPSFLIQVPHEQSDVPQDADSGDHDTTPNHAAQNNDPMGLGHLKSIGE